jgi:hypothetical protein
MQGQPPGPGPQPFGLPAGALVGPGDHGSQWLTVPIKANQGMHRGTERQRPYPTVTLQCNAGDSLRNRSEDCIWILLCVSGLRLVQWVPDRMGRRDPTGDVIGD